MVGGAPPLHELFEGEEESEASWARTVVAENLSLLLQPSVAAVWGISALVARHLAAHPQLVRRKSVLELGAGAALPSLAAAALGAATVLATDCDAAGCAAASRAAAANGLEAVLCVASLDWFSPESRAAVRQSEVVLACDCNYYVKAVEPLFETCAACVARGGLLVLASRTGRAGHSDCLRAIEADGIFACESVVEFVGEDGGGRELPLCGVSRLLPHPVEGAVMGSAEGGFDARDLMWLFRRGVL